MASTHLEKILSNLKAKPSKKSKIQRILHKVESAIGSKLQSGSLILSKRQRYRVKRKSEPSQEKPKYTQKDYMAIFKEKAEESRSFALKLIKEQNERKQRQEKREEKLKQQHLEVIEEEEMEKLNLAQERERIKQEQLNDLIERSRERKEHLQRLREISEREYRKAVSQTPLYKKIESDFIQNFEIPALEKRKEELRKKHEYFRPLDYEELKERDRNLKVMQSVHKSKLVYTQRSKSSKSKFLKRIMDEEKEKTQQEVYKAELRKDMIFKKKKYAEIVREIFSPSVDLLKQKEIELIKAKLKSPVTRIKKDVMMDRSISHNPKKFKKNTMVPEKPPKKEPVIKNYIEEFRAQRKRSLSLKDLSHDLSDLSYKSPKQLAQLAEKLEKEARLAEIKFSHLSPFNSKSIHFSEQVNNCLVNSIKTKIAILDNQ